MVVVVVIAGVLVSMVRLEQGGHHQLQDSRVHACYCIPHCFVRLRLCESRGCPVLSWRTRPVDFRTVEWPKFHRRVSVDFRYRGMGFRRVLWFVLFLIVVVVVVVVVTFFRPINSVSCVLPPSFTTTS